MRSKKMKRGGSSKNNSMNSKKNYSKLCKQKCKDKKYKWGDSCGLKNNMCTFYGEDGHTHHCNVGEFYKEVKKDNVKFAKLKKTCNFK